MRIKSYFAPSVQAAIAQARHEFGDDITLVTSHITPPETRHLGEYEVVFGIDDPRVPVVQAEPVSQPAAAAFQDLLQQAISSKSPLYRDLSQRMADLKSNFIEIGMEPHLVRALMPLIEHSASYALEEKKPILLPAAQTPPQPLLLGPATIESAPEAKAAAAPSNGAPANFEKQLDPSVLDCFFGEHSDKQPFSDLWQAASKQMEDIVREKPKKREPASAPPVIFANVFGKPEPSPARGENGTAREMPSSSPVIDASLLAAFSGAGLRSPDASAEEPVPARRFRPLSSDTLKAIFMTLAAACSYVLRHRFKS